MLGMVGRCSRHSRALLAWLQGVAVDGMSLSAPGDNHGEPAVDIQAAH